MTALEDRHFYPNLKRNVTDTSSGSRVVSYMSDLGPDVPILTLIHGYPQSAFMYRLTLTRNFFKKSILKLTSFLVGEM